MVRRDRDKDWRETQEEHRNAMGNNAFRASPDIVRMNRVSSHGKKEKESEGNTGPATEGTVTEMNKKRKTEKWRKDYLIERDKLQRD